MATVIESVVEQLQQLDEDLQQRVLNYARLLAQDQEQPKDLGYWLEQADIFREQLELRYGINHFDSQQILDELREGDNE